MTELANNDNNNNNSNTPCPPETTTIAPSSLIQINHGEQLTPSNSIHISLIKPSTMESTMGPTDSHNFNQVLQIHYLKTRVQDIKTHISSTWKGKPKTDGIRLIARGRILNDSEVVGKALATTPEIPSPPHPIHVVIRPNAWTEKLPLAPPRPLSAPPTASTYPPIPNTGSIPASSSSPLPSSLRSSANIPNLTNPLGPNEPPSLLFRPNLVTPPNASEPSSLSSPAQLFNAYFSGLTAYGRIHFIQNIFQAQFKVVERLDFLRRQLHHNHLKLLGISRPSNTTDLNQSNKNDKEWKRIEEKLISLLIELKFPHPYSGHAESATSQPLLAEDDPCLPLECSEFKRVEIAGLPYLLYLPESLNHQSLKGGYTGTTSPLKEYQSLQIELNRTLRLESQVQFLILQAQKTQANLNQMDDIISAGLRPNDTPAHDREMQQAQRIFDGLFPPNAFPFPRPPHPHGAGPALGLGLGLGPAVDGLHPPNNFMHPNGPMWQHPMARVRRYEFTINLDSIRRYMAPLLWLSLKLSVLLYIFGRHASYGKLVILIMIALGWVIWEAYTIHQRHDAQARRRDRLQRVQQGPGAPAGAAAPAVDPIQAVLDRGRRRAERERLQLLLRDQRQRGDGVLGMENPDGGAAPPLNPQPPPVLAPAQPAQPAAPPAAPEAPVANPPAPPAAPRRNPGRGGLRAAAADIRARGGAFPPGTEVRPFRNTSAFSPKYWFNSIAVVGLASEYRELGLHSIGERAMGASNLEYPRWYRYLRNFKTCLVLFIGTLLPEIEKKRRKALEKRARILNLVIADAARDANNQPRNPPQQPRVAGGPVEANNEAPTTTSAPAVSPPVGQSSNAGPETPNKRPETAADGPDTQQTPKALAATALEPAGSGSSGQNLTFRRLRFDTQTDDVKGRTSPPASGMLMDTASSSTEPYTLGKLATSSTAAAAAAAAKSTVVAADSNHSDIPVPSSSSAPVSSTSTSAPEQQQSQEAAPIDMATLQSPLTPLDTPQVVGGLDDTDDEEIPGGDNEEAGMLLF